MIKNIIYYKWITNILKILNKTDSYGGVLLGYNNVNIQIAFGKKTEKPEKQREYHV